MLEENLELFETKPSGAPKSLSRRDWVNACSFFPMSDQETLEQVVRKTSEYSSLGLRPVVILDLDSTLYEVKPRTFHILKEWSNSHESLPFEETRDLFKNLSGHQVGYSIKDTFSELGLCHEKNNAAFESIKTFWRNRFFTNDYLFHDHPYPGSPDFAWKVYNAGAHIVYLTGRDDPGMGRGTQANLIRDQFPHSKPKITSLLKPKREMNDLLHKRKATEKIQTLGTVIASFENEPLNLVSLSKIFPEAMHVFVDTVCSSDPAPVTQGIYRIRNFI